MFYSLPGSHSGDARIIGDIMYGKNHSTNILIVNGVHGDELSAHTFAKYLQIELCEICTTQPALTLRLITSLNEAGIANMTQYNANHVDLNRNFPSKNWEQGQKDPTRKDYHGPYAGSEAETVMLMQHVKAIKPDMIFSFHDPYGLIDWDGPIDESHHVLQELATEVFENRYPLKKLGARPGSMGSFFAEEMGIPLITFEFNYLETFDDLKYFAKKTAKFFHELKL